MSLTEWLKTAYGVDFDPADGLHGGPLAEALCRAQEEADLDYGSQRAALHEAADRLHDLAFSNACLDHVDAIDAYLARRASMVSREVRKCHSGVVKNKDWGAGAEYAELRFAAARAIDDDLLDAVDDMCRLMAAEGYVELRDDVVRDLRQGLGYYRPGEDTVRRRRTVRWLRGQNALHFWIAAMLGGRDPLIRVATVPQAAGSLPPTSLSTARTMLSSTAVSSTASCATRFSAAGSSVSSPGRLMHNKYIKYSLLHYIIIM